MGPGKLAEGLIAFPAIAGKVALVAKADAGQKPRCGRVSGPASRLNAVDAGLKAEGRQALADGHGQPRHGHAVAHVIGRQKRAFGHPGMARVDQGKDGEGASGRAAGGHQLQGALRLGHPPFGKKPKRGVRYTPHKLGLDVVMHIKPAEDSHGGKVLEGVHADHGIRPSP